jgi:lipopolysaccharide biosynthesis glycosyltransferase
VIFSIWLVLSVAVCPVDRGARENSSVAPHLRAGSPAGRRENIGRPVTTDDDRLVIASAADAAYAVPLAAMLRSAVRPGTPLSVHIVDAGLGEDDRGRLEGICAAAAAELTWHDAASALDPYPLNRRMTMATYARLELPRLLPPDVRKVVWLDCDVLVTGDLGGLWRTELDGRHLLAVQDPCVPLVSSRYGIRRWRELGLAERAKYFNAGVMLIDLDRWRRDGIAERAGAYLRESGEDVVFWDQEGLNAVLSGRWGALDLRWNWCSGFTPREEPASVGLDPWIVHFAGNLKPWLLPAPETGPRALFYRLLDETPWAGWRPRRTVTSVTRGWYEASRVRDVFYPAEHWWVLRR